MFIRIQTKTYGKGNVHYYAFLVENARVNGKVVQTIKASLGPVSPEQIPYLKAAYAREKPKLVYQDGTVFDPSSPASAGSIEK